MARREYYNDPEAPAPNSLGVATSAVVTDDAGRVLLQRRTDSGNWALPGAGVDMSESLACSVIREVKEETGFDVEVTGPRRHRPPADHRLHRRGGPPPVEHLLHRPHHRRETRDQR